jgi:hypothetical protein
MYNIYLKDIIVINSDVDLKRLCPSIIGVFPVDHMLHSSGPFSPLCMIIRTVVEIVSARTYLNHAVLSLSSHNNTWIGFLQRSSPGGSRAFFQADDELKLGNVYFTRQHFCKVIISGHFLDKL